MSQLQQYSLIPDNEFVMWLVDTAHRSRPSFVHSYLSHINNPTARNVSPAKIQTIAFLLDRYLRRTENATAGYEFADYDCVHGPYDRALDRSLWVLDFLDLIKNNFTEYDFDDADMSLSSSGKSSLKLSVAAYHGDSMKYKLSDARLKEMEKLVKSYMAMPGRELMIKATDEWTAEHPEKREKVLKFLELAV